MDDSDQDTAVQRDVRWGLPTALGSLLSFLALNLVVATPLVYFGVDRIAATVIATAVGWIGLAGWPLLAARRRGRGPVADFDLRFRPVDLASGLGVLVVILVVAAAFVAIYRAITGETPSSSVGVAAQGATEPWQLVLLALLALGAPFVEEVHFRGAWWNALRRKGLGRWPTLLVTSALFAVIHFELQRMVLLFLMGLVIGFVRLVSRRLGPAIVAHLLVNGLGAVSLLAQIGAG